MILSHRTTLHKRQFRLDRNCWIDCVWLWKHVAIGPTAQLAQLGYGVELQAQARQALAFLYREILGQVLPWPEIARARGEASAGIEDSSPSFEGPCEEKNQSGGKAPHSKGPKLLERARAVLRGRRYSLSTEECYITSRCVKNSSTSRPPIREREKQPIPR